MAWLSCDKNGAEHIFAKEPHRESSPHFGEYWNTTWLGSIVELPKGSIKKLIGRELSWSDDAVELK